jgi:hypothetical protein
MIVCPLCGVPYPAQYHGCPRCVERERSAWRVAVVIIVAAIALYTIVRLATLAPVVASRL